MNDELKAAFDKLYADLVESGVEIPACKPLPELHVTSPQGDLWEHIYAHKRRIAELEVAAKRVIQLWLPTKDRSDTTFGDALHELSEALK